MNEYQSAFKNIDFKAGESVQDSPLLLQHRQLKEQPQERRNQERMIEALLREPFTQPLPPDPFNIEIQEWAL